MTSPENDAFVRSFARGLSVIEAMGRGTGSHTVASVADATQLPRTVARRILLTLAQLGYAVADDKGFRLTPKILNLSLTYLTSLPFWGAAQGVLEQLCVELKESAALSVFDGRDAVYLMRVPSAKVTPLRLGVGSPTPRAPSQAQPSCSPRWRWCARAAMPGLMANSIPCSAGWPYRFTTSAAKWWPR